MKAEGSRLGFRIKWCCLGSEMRAIYRHTRHTEQLYWIFNYVNKLFTLRAKAPFPFSLFIFVWEGSFVKLVYCFQRTQFVCFLFYMHAYFHYYFFFPRAVEFPRLGVPRYNDTLAKFNSEISASKGRSQCW